MGLTLIIYDCISNFLDDIIKNIMRSLGPSKVMKPSEFNGDFQKYDSIAIGPGILNGNSDSLNNITDFIDRYMGSLIKKNVALFCISDNCETAESYLNFLKRKMNGYIVWSDYFIEFRNGFHYESEKQLAEIIKEQIYKYIDLKRCLKDSFDMPKDTLKSAILDFIKLHNTCSLCTCCYKHVRATPIEFQFIDDIFYFISEGGEKFAGILSNPNVSIAIYDSYKGFDSLGGLQIEGSAQIVDPFSDEYYKVMASRGIGVKQIKNLPAMLNMIKVKPKRFEFLNSNLRKKGYNAKQVFNIA